MCRSVLTILLIQSLVSCEYNHSKVTSEKFLYRLKPNSKDSIEVEISLHNSKKTVEMTVAVRNSRDKYLYDMGAMSNAEFNTQQHSNPIREVKMDNDSIPEYIVEGVVSGSTYGAFTNFIIWSNNDDWFVTKLPFDRAFVEDKDSDGVYEIVNYYSNGSKMYIFRNGNVVEK